MMFHTKEVGTLAENGSVVIKIKGDDNDFKSKLQSLGNAVSTTMKATAAVITGTGAALAGLGAYAVKVGSEFESSMSQVAATMGMTTEEIHNGSAAYETLANAAKQAGATTKFTATQAADALNYLALAGYDAATSAEVLPSVLNLAAAGGLDLAYASDLATDAMAALGIEASAANLTQFGDQMARASSKANYSVAQLGEAILTVGGTAKNLAGSTVELNTALGVLANRGIKGAEGGTALRNMILSLSAPTDKAAATMKSLGLSAFDAEGNLRPLNEVFKDLDAAMQNLSGEEKTNVLNDIFNKVDLKSAEAMLAGCGEEFDNLAEAIANSDGAMQDMADVQMDNLKGQITLLQSAVEGLGVSLYENMDGAVKDAVGAAAGYISELNAVMNAAFSDSENPENVEKLTKSLMELGYSAEEAETMIGSGMSGVVSSLGGILAQALTDAASAAPVLLDAGTEMLSAFLEGIQENSDSLMDSALSIVSTLGEGILALLPMMADTAASLVVSLADGLKENLPEMVPAAVEAIGSLVENLTANADTILQAGIEIILALGQGIINALPQLIEIIPQIVINIADVINQNASRMLGVALQLIVQLGVGLIQNIPTLAANIPAMIEAIVKAFFAFQWVSLGTNLITAIGNGIKSMGGTMTNAAAEVSKAFAGKIKELPQALLQVGKDIVNGLINGIKGAIPTLGQAAKEMSANLLTNVKSFFRIASPSKVMKEEVGEMLGEGIAVGITESGKEAVKAAEEVANDIVVAMAGVETAVPYARRTAQKVGDVLKSELTKQNAALQEIQRQADEMQAAEELEQHKKQLAEKQEELNKAEKKNKQKIQEEIANLEADWNKKQADAAKAAEKQKLQEKISALQEFQKEYESALSSIESKQSSLSDKLSDYGSLFERVETEEGKELFQLGDLDAEIKKIEKYGAAIDKLQEKGISSGLLNEISGMGVDDALDYMNKLSSMSDAKFDQYMQKYEEKQKLAAETAEKFYQSEFDALEQAYTERLPETLEDVKEEMYQAGTEAAQSLQKGLQADGEALGDTVTEAVSSAVVGASEATQETTMEQIVLGLQEQQHILTDYVDACKVVIIALIESFYSEFRYVGQYMMEGVAQGIEDGRSGVVNAVARVIAAAVRRAREDLDINSPSKVFAEIGGYMAQGIGVGWTDRMEIVSEDIGRNLSVGMEKRMAGAYERIKATMQDGMQRLSGDIAVQSRGDTSYNTYTTTHQEGDFIVQIEKVVNEGKETVSSMMQEFEFVRRQQVLAKGGV